jgi:6-phosphogluconolactonase (cycloisomerase 2 family)
VLPPDAVLVYTANYVGDSVSGVLVETEDGTLSELGGSPFAADDGTWTVAAGPEGDRLFVANNNASTVQSFEIGSSSGRLEEVDAEPASDYAGGAAVAPDGRFLYTGGMDTGQVDSWSVNLNSAALTALGTENILGVPVALAVHPSGSFLYTVQSNVDSVNIYSIGSDGALGGSLLPYVAGDFAWALAISAGGEHMYVANIGDNTLHALGINPADGDLSPISTYVTGQFPTGVAITPDGGFVYVSDASGITIFSRNTSTGALTNVGGEPAGSSPEALAIDQTGTVLAVVDSVDDTLRVYQIDADSGVLAESPDSPFAIGEQPRSVVIVNPQ